MIQTRLLKEIIASVSDLRLTPYVASLRIYEPIEVFPDFQKITWNKLLANTKSKNIEQFRALKRMVTTEVPVLQNDEVHIIELEGKKYCCPWSSLNRTFQALFNFKAAMPHQIFDYFVGDSFEKEIFSSAQVVQDKISHIKSETWNIPPRWFGLFKPEERFFGRDESGAFTYFRTNLNSAIKRCKFMHKIVLATFGIGPIEQEIRELIEWLNTFDQNSLIELDYGGLAIYLDKVLISEGQSGIQSDTSVEDLQLSLAGLASSDSKKAGQGYERLISRWRKVANFEQAI